MRIYNFIMAGLLLTSIAHAESTEKTFEIEKLITAGFTYEKSDPVFTYSFESEGCNRGGAPNPAQFRLKVISQKSYFANGLRRLHVELGIEVFQALELRCRIYDEVAGSIKLKDLLDQQAATLPFDIKSEPTEAGITFIAPKVTGGIVIYED